VSTKAVAIQNAVSVGIKSVKNPPLSSNLNHSDFLINFVQILKIPELIAVSISPHKTQPS